VLINSFHLHVFQNLAKACAQDAGLMLVFLHQHWMDFVMGTKISSNYRLLSTFSTVDHVKNAQSCVNCVNTHCGTYGGTYENRTSFSTGQQDSKSLTLIWDTGASYGPTLFRSDLLTMSSVKFLSGMSLRSTQLWG